MTEETKRKVGRPKGGAKAGGRRKGSPNKKSIEIAGQLEAYGLDPLEGLVAFATGRIICTHCNAAGKVSIDQYYNLKRIAMSEAHQEMTAAKRSVIGTKCPSCAGTKKRPVDDGLQLKSLTEIMQYIAPKRKAIDLNHSSHKTFEEMLADLSE